VILSEIKVETNKILCLSRNLKQCTLLESDDKLQQVKNFTYLGWRSQMMEDGKKKLIQELVKQTQLCVNLIKRKLSNTAEVSVFKSVFFAILTYRHESWVMNERVISRVQAADMDVRKDGKTDIFFFLEIGCKNQTFLKNPKSAF